MGYMRGGLVVGFMEGAHHHGEVKNDGERGTREGTQVLASLERGSEMALITKADAGRGWVRCGPTRPPRSSWLPSRCQDVELGAAGEHSQRHRPHSRDC